MIKSVITKQYFLTDKLPAEINLGDTIHFSLNTGEPVTAKAMRQEADGMLFVFVDCLRTEYPMNSTDTNKGGYKESELRKTLNTEILDTFPDFIKSAMKPVYEEDKLRLLTAMEVFGKNEFGDEDDGGQLIFMKNVRERIAFQGNVISDWDWYWLQSKCKSTAASFAYVNYYGTASYNYASNVFGVRPAFKI